MMLPPARHPKSDGVLPGGKSSPPAGQPQLEAPVEKVAERQAEKPAEKPAGKELADDSNDFNFNIGLLTEPAEKKNRRRIWRQSGNPESKRCGRFRRKPGSFTP